MDFEVCHLCSYTEPSLVIVFLYSNQCVSQCSEEEEDEEEENASPGPKGQSLHQSKSLCWYHITLTQHVPQGPAYRCSSSLWNKRGATEIIPQHTGLSLCTESQAKGQQQCSFHLFLTVFSKEMEGRECSSKR